MSDHTEVFEEIFSNETVSIENIDKTPLSVKLISDKGCHVEIELRPGQVMGFSTGDANAKILLLSGDPANLLVIRPEAAS